MAQEVLCGRCGMPLTNMNAPCPRCGAPASGGYYTPMYRQPKSPAVAAALAVVPGCGHFYLGHNVKGIAYLAGILGFQLFDLGLDLSVIGASIGVPLELGPFGLYAYSIVDAYRTARRMQRGF
jgi:TM2 domain-containing membrane protein YozV